MKRTKRNPGEVLVVMSKVREYLASKGMRSGGDVAEGLSETVRHHLDKAIERAKAHNKQTVGARDL